MNQRATLAQLEAPMETVKDWMVWTGEKVSTIADGMAKGIRKAPSLWVGWITVFILIIASIVILYGCVPAGMKDLLLVAGATLALATYVLNRTKHQHDIDFKQSEINAEAAEKLLEAAIDAFTDGKPGSIPKNDPIVWSAVARMLRQYSDLAKTVSQPEHLKMLRGAEGIVRHHFYRVLFADRPDSIGPDYFKGGDRPAIEMSSVIVIYSFASELTEDPLMNFDVGAELAKDFTPWPIRFPEAVERYIREDPVRAAALDLAQARYGNELRGKYGDTPGEGPLPQ